MRSKKQVMGGESGRSMVEMLGVLAMMGLLVNSVVATADTNCPTGTNGFGFEKVGFVKMMSFP